MAFLHSVDPEIAGFIEKELKRSQDGLEMIPSENFTSRAVMEALGSVGTNKYSEGYPGKRYYGGCEWVDAVETAAQERAKALFGVDHVNVQPASGCAANIAVMFALLEPGDTLMGMHLFYGGHMTHGLKINFSGKYYNSVQYATGPDGRIDYDEVMKMAEEHKPKLIIAGASAYPRIIDWSKFREVADAVGAFFLADVSHVTGLIVSGDHPSPVGHAHVITTTTHKSLRGPRGAMIMANGNPSTPLKKVERTAENIPTLIDRAIIPGIQGGPHNHQTAAIAVALKEAAEPSFQEYGHQIVRNAKALAQGLMDRGIELVTGGTDNHLMLIDLTKHGVFGKQVEHALHLAGITANKNTIPHDPRKPFDPSGIRLGTPAITTRGMKEAEMELIADVISEVIAHVDDEVFLVKQRERVEELTEKFPLYPGLTYLA